MNASVRARLLFAAAAGLCWLAATTGCRRASGGVEQREAVVIFAATSLRDVFARIGREFERRTPGVELRFNFAGTQELRTQLEHGARADLFASADQRHIDALVEAKRVEAPVVFARNEPVIVVAPDGAERVRSFGDLGNAERLVIGAPEVPIGRYTAQILDRAGRLLGPAFRRRVEARVVSRELNARQVLAKVRLGEAQAGIVYRTDARTTPELTIVTIPAEVNVLADYPVAVVQGSARGHLARAWIAFLLSSDGQRLLAGAGFLPPPRGR